MKILKIEDCSDCPHCDDTGFFPWCDLINKGIPDKYRGVILDDCPLEDYKEPTE